MGLLLTPQVMARYNTLFRFLMRLKRVQLQLEGSWQSLHSLSTHKGSRVGTPDGPGGGDEAAAAEVDAASKLRELQHVRHHMSHLVTNLQIYIQVIPWRGTNVDLVAISLIPTSDLYHPNFPSLMLSSPTTSCSRTGLLQPRTLLRPSGPTPPTCTRW